MDAAKAVKATAHQLARLVYAMLTRGEEYVACDIAEWEAERRDRTIANPRRRAKTLQSGSRPGRRSVNRASTCPSFHARGGQVA